MKFTKEQRHEAYEKLSEEAKSFVSSDENIAIIEKLSQDFHLNATQSDILDSEVYFAMVGLFSFEEVATNLRNELSLTPDQSSSLISALNNGIFSKIQTMRSTGHYLATDIPNDTNQIQPDQTTPETTLMSSESMVPSTDLVEDRIMPLVGTPGEKLAWEQRKQKLGELETPKSTYGTVDPYREPI